MTASSRVAFVGLGAIGLPMAASLVRAGLPVLGVEPTAAGRERAAAAGVEAVASLDAVAEAGTVVVMVATADQLSDVVEAGLAAGLVAGTTWILMSTVGPDAVRSAAARLASAGAAVIDAPVSGGIARAESGDLALFVSGDDAALAAADGVLRALGTPHRVGAEVGDGQSVKVVNQHLCAVHIVAAAEALALAERLGLDPGFVREVVGAGAAASFMLDDRGARMLEGSDAPVRSQVAIFVKDTGLVAEAAGRGGAEVPLLRAAQARFAAAADAGLVHADDSSVIETYRGAGAQG